MTVNTTNTETSTLADGVEVVYNFDFQSLSANWVLAYTVDPATNERTDWTGFTVFLNSDQENTPGGTVTFGTPPPSAHTVVIYRQTPVTQNTDYTDYDAFPAESTEDALDKLTFEIQEVDANRSNPANEKAISDIYAALDDVRGALPFGLLIIGDSLSTAMGGINGDVRYGTDVAGTIIDITVINGGSGYPDTMVVFEPDVGGVESAYFTVSATDGIITGAIAASVTGPFTGDQSNQKITVSDSEITGYNYQMVEDGTAIFTDAANGRRVTTFDYPGYGPFAKEALVMLGTNDAYVGHVESEYKDKYREILDGLATDGYTASCVLPIQAPFFQTSQTQELEEVRQWTRDVCAEYSIAPWDVPIVSTTDLLHPDQYGHDIIRIVIFELFGLTVDSVGGGSGGGDFYADGSVPMTGQLRAISGTDAAPGYTFVGDTDTGMFRDGPRIKWTINGVDCGGGSTEFGDPIWLLPNLGVSGDASIIGDFIVTGTTTFDGDIDGACTNISLTSADAGFKGIGLTDLAPSQGEYVKIGPFGVLIAGGSSPGTGAEWGQITGTLSDQTDLNDALLDGVSQTAGGTQTIASNLALTGSSVNINPPVSNNWNFLSLGNLGQIVDSDVNAGSFAAAVHNQAASTINSGTFANARISQSNVTQHGDPRYVQQSSVLVPEAIAKVSSAGSYLSESGFFGGVSKAGTGLYDLTLDSSITTNDQIVICSADNGGICVGSTPVSSSVIRVSTFNVVTNAFADADFNVAVYDGP